MLAQVGDFVTREVPFDGDELVLLLLVPEWDFRPELPRGRPNINILATDEDGIRCDVSVSARAGDRQAATAHFEEFQERLRCELEGVPADIGEAEKLAESFRFRHSNTDDLVDECLGKVRDQATPTLCIVPPKLDTPAYSLDWDSVMIRLPREVALTVMTCEGVSIQGRHADLTTLCRGNAWVRDSRGNATIAVSGGGVQARGMTGDVRIALRVVRGSAALRRRGVTGASRVDVGPSPGGGRDVPAHQLHARGTIDVREVSGDLHAEADWSAVSIEGVVGDIRVRNVRGDTEVGLSREYIESGSRVDLQSVHGDIHLAMEPSEDAQVRLETDFGVIEVQGEELGKHLSYTVGSTGPVFVATARQDEMPNPRISARTDAGSIYVAQGQSKTY
jgi:hypothetical protein